MACVLCWWMAFNGFFVCLVSFVSNVAFVFIIVGAFVTWKIKMCFVMIYKNLPYDETPRIWPFQSYDE